MRKIALLLVFLILLIISAYAEVSSSSINWLSKRRADTRYCIRDGNCNLTSATIGNLTVQNYINVNVTVINFNITGNMIAYGNITADYFIGDGTFITNVIPGNDDELARIGSCPSGYAVQNITSGENETCLQEQFNESTTCGGLDSGTMSTTGTWVNRSEVTDNNYGTAGYSSGGDISFFINYTKPAGYRNATWQVKSDNGIFNLTVPSSCSNAYSDKLAFLVRSKSSGGAEHVTWYCIESDQSWTQMAAHPSITCNGCVFEEAVIWSIARGTECIPINESGADNLGNHLATQNLNLSNFNLTDVRNIRGVNSTDLEFRVNKDIGVWL
jgi:hypothetical protein